MKVHLVDGTYELFRHFYGVPRETNARGREVAATRAVVASIIGMLEGGATHVGVATDHVIESFRNELWPGYKDGTGIDPDLYAQFGLLEDALRGLGVIVWAMVEFEADDALCSGAVMATADDRVEQVLICTPDKDLAQCVRGDRVIQFDRRRRKLIDRDGVVEKFGVPPESIPDYLALVGDSADGFPGLAGWGAKSSSAVLARYRRIEDVPALAHDWDVSVRGAKNLAATLASERELALLFKTLATLRTDVPLGETVDDLQWRGPGEGFAEICEALEATDLVQRAVKLAEARS